MARRHFHKPKTSIFGIVSKVAPYVAFVSQITGKDTAAIQSQPNTVSQLQAYANAITGRLTGINIFKGNSVQARQTINIAGVANQWSGMGLAAMIYGEMGKHFSILPQAGKVRSVGKKVFLGGVLGGLFDDPTPQTNYIQQSYGNLGIVNPQASAVTSGTLPVVGMRPY